jgi:hypothetical protein
MSTKKDHHFPSNVSNCFFPRLLQSEKSHPDEEGPRCFDERNNNAFGDIMLLFFRRDERTNEEAARISPSSIFENNDLHNARKKSHGGADTSEI